MLGVGADDLRRAEPDPPVACDRRRLRAGAGRTGPGHGRRPTGRRGRDQCRLALPAASGAGDLSRHDLAGPALDSVPKEADDPMLRHLAGELAARRVPLEQASAQIDQFAAGLPAERRNEGLTQLFAATLAIINHDRSSIIRGIGKYVPRPAGARRPDHQEQRTLDEIAQRSDPGAGCADGPTRLGHAHLRRSPVATPWAPSPR